MTDGRGSGKDAAQGELRWCLLGCGRDLIVASSHQIPFRLIEPSQVLPFDLIVQPQPGSLPVKNLGMTANHPVSGADWVVDRTPARGMQGSRSTSLYCSRPYHTLHCLMVAQRTDRYLVSNLGTCLWLKLCGFVTEHQAEIRDVSEQHLRLRLGGTWLQRLLGTASPAYPLDLEIRITPTESEVESRSEAQLQIVIRDASLISHVSDFEAASRRVLWQLRNHMLVVSS